MVAKFTRAFYFCKHTRYPRPYSDKLKWLSQREPCFLPPVPSRYWPTEDSEASVACGGHGGQESWTGIANDPPAGQGGATLAHRGRIGPGSSAFAPWLMRRGVRE